MTVRLGAAGLLLGAMGTGLVAQWLVVTRRDSLWGWVVYAVAAGLAAVASASLGPPGATPEPAVAPGPGPRIRARAAARVLCAVGALAALVLATALAASDRQPVGALTSWVAGFLLATVAVRGWRVAPAVRGAEPWTRAEVLTVAAIVGVAATVRVLWIADIPRYIFGDESRVGLYLLGAFRERIPDFFGLGWNTWPVLGLALQGLFGPVLGLNTTVLRLSSALAGTLAVLATYGMARHLFSRRVALLAAVLLAVGRTAVDFSRLGTCHAQVMLWEAMAFCWWWRAVNTGLAGSYLWAGIGLGLCLYAYNAGQAVPPLLFGWWIATALLRPGAAVAHARGALVTVAGFVLAALPLFYDVSDRFRFGDNWRLYTHMARNRQVMSAMADAWSQGDMRGALEILGRQAGRTWLGFGVIPGDAYQMGYRGGGMLDHVTAVLFVLGLGVALPHLRGRCGFVVYWWLVVSVFGSVLTRDPPAVVRLVGVLPALALLAALPLDGWVRAARAAGWQRARLAGPALAALVLAGAAWDNWRTYFVLFPAENIDEISELARLVRRTPASSRVAVLGVEHFLRFQNEEVFMLDFPDRRLEQVAEPAHFLPLHVPLDGPLVLVVGPTQLSWVPYMRQWYPNATVEEVRWAKGGRLLFPVIGIPAADALARTGLRVTAAGSGAGAPAVVADPFAPAAPPGSGAGGLGWSGRVYWPTDRPVSVTVRSAAPVEVHIGNAPPIRVAGGGTGTATVSFPRGWQPIRIEEGEGAQGSRGLVMAIDDGAGTARELTRWDVRPDGGMEGLRATFTRDGETLQRTIEPQVNLQADEGCWYHPAHLPVRTPFEAELDGALRVTVPGEYELETYSTGPYEIRLSGDVICEAAAARAEEPARCQVRRVLEAGTYPLHLRWTAPRSPTSSRRVFQLYWTPPGGERELVPPWAFVPPGGDG